MSMIRLPGFTAEASLRQTAGRYRNAPGTTHIGLAAEPARVEPAMRMQTFCERYGSVKMCCIVWDGGQFCVETTVFWP